MQLVIFDTKRPDTSWDVKRKKWIGYRIDIRVNGKRYRNRFPNRKKAESFIEDLRDKKKRNKAGVRLEHSYTLKELFEKRKERLEGKELTRAIRVFRTFIEVNGNLPVTSTTKQHFQFFVNKRLEDGVSPATVNREVTVLSPCFKNAAELFADLNVSIDVARAKEKKKRGFKRTISESEMIQIRDNLLNQKLPKERQPRKLARPHFARMFEVAWMLGLRLGEAKGFKPDDLKGDVLIVRRGKTKTITEMPGIPARAIELLQQGPFELCSEHTLNDMLREACEAAKVPYGRGGLDTVTFHSTRHSFTTRLTQVTDIATTASFTGHSDKEMVVYYSHASEESQRAAMERLYGSSDIKEVFEKVKNGQMSLKTFTRWAQTHHKGKD